MRETTGAILTQVGSNSYMKAKSGVLDGRPERRSLKTLKVCKPGSSLVVRFENNAICWVVAHALFDLVNTTGNSGNRGDNSATLQNSWWTLR